MQQQETFGRLSFVGPLAWLQQPTWLARAGAFCIFQLAFYLAYRYAMTFSHATASPFWFPDSILLTALLLTHPRRWWVWILAPLPIRLTVATPDDAQLWFLLTAFAIDSLKALATTFLLRRFLDIPTRFSSVREYSTYALLAVVLVPAVTALAGAGARAQLGFDYWSTWERWFLGNALTHLIVTPTIFYWLLSSDGGFERAVARNRLEAVALVAGLCVACYLAFTIVPGTLVFADPRLYAPVPFLLWAAVRFGTRGTTGAIAMSAFFAVASALQNRGPFAGLSPLDTAVALQHFLLAWAAPMCFIAVVVEQERRVEHALRESEARFRVMADSAPVLIWMSDRAASREFFNHTWLDFVGRTIAQESGSGWSQGVHPEDLHLCIENCRAAFETRREFEIEYRLRRNDGEYRWILDKGVPRSDTAGRFVGYVGCAFDITAHKRAEESNRNLAHVTRLAVVGELTGMIAHEIKQPLAAILANAWAGRRMLDLPNPRLDELGLILDDIREDDLRADQVIKRLQNLLRRGEIQLQPLDINDCVVDALMVASSDLSKRQIIVHKEFDDLPPVSGDRVHLQQVLLNFFVNAMEAMSETPAPQRKLTVRTCLHGTSAVEVSVSDRGCGLPTAQVSSLFDSFVTTKASGLGLGLSVARSIIESHGGQISAANNTDGGATFKFIVSTTAGTADDVADPMDQQSAPLRSRA